MRSAKEARQSIVSAEKEWADSCMELADEWVSRACRMYLTFVDFEFPAQLIQFIPTDYNLTILKDVGVRDFRGQKTEVVVLRLSWSE